MNQPWPGLPGADGMPPRPPKQRGTGATVIQVVLIVLAVLLGVRVIGNEMSRSNPPASCQILGGSWSIWDGWHCG